MEISGILLAAGLSRRMGENKLLLPWQGQPLLTNALALLETSPLAEKILVVSAETAVNFELPKGIQVVINPCPEEGQASSLRLGVEEATGDGYLFLTADQPFLDGATVSEILNHASPNHIVIPTVDGVPGSPVFFPRRFRQELLALTGDSGGKQLIKTHKENCIFLAITNKKALIDLDTKDDYRQICFNTVK